jgi:hypothetical protein
LVGEPFQGGGPAVGGDDGRACGGTSARFAKPIEQLLQVGRQRHLEAEPLARDRMGEAELGGVQRAPRGGAAIFQRLLEQRLAVHFVAADKVAVLRQMDADLMRAARFQAAGDKRVVA